MVYLLDTNIVILYLRSHAISCKIVEMYAEIDAYSQNRLPTKSLNNTPRNMGKNDIWIATTAAVADAKLLTLDKDFTHLDGIYFEVIYFQNEL